ncbi:alanine racemase [Jeongeupia naejangsanensis]|uniref:Alanine racemase n=1 Tax=Jeongeupia naejangsanensis TaxID=613195 RepID=A0ABS2BHW5_9NEIS|nr:alanine racemase [Jeongeupia naejangsanensis]MBM3115199.1 alanine racemase [Jeongeupia naejangsanensis]
MSRPIQVLIDSAAIAHNYRRIKALAPNAKVYAVAKANGYGHGLERVAAAVPDADGFALVEFNWAVALRETGVTQPILLLEGVFSADEMAGASRHALTVAVHEERALVWLETLTLPRPVDIYVKLNTGMNRLGFAAEAAGAVVARLKACPNVGSITLMTHFATADDPERGIAKPLARFDTAAAGLGLPMTLANSAAIFDFPEVHRDWVRPGIALYGATPFAHRSAASLGLVAAMSLQSEIIGVQTLQAGDAVGYAAAFTASGPMRIGVIACGYADGYPRHAPTGTPVLVGGVRTRLLGRVSMDMLAVDLSDLPQAQIGTPVELWGKNLPIDEVANAAGTIGYELMCAVALRVPVRTL